MNCTSIATILVARRYSRVREIVKVMSGHLPTSNEWRVQRDHSAASQFSDFGPNRSLAASSPQIARDPVVPPPRRDAGTEGVHAMPTRLRLLQLAEWENDRQYDEDPPSSIHYTIEWKVTHSEKNKKNRKLLFRDTEQDVVLAPAAYWTQVLQPKLRQSLKKKTPQSKPRAEDTVAVVHVNDRSERDLIKQFDGLKVDWRSIEVQLVAWGELFLDGKKLRVNLTFHVADHGLGDSGSSSSSGKRGRRSATQRMLTQLDEQTQRDSVSGRPAVWVGVYELMRCPGPPCHLGPHCWRDPVGGKHYRLLTHQLKRLVQYKEQGNKLKTHEDVPNDVREELFAVEQQRLEREHKTSAASASKVPSIQITNVMPGNIASASGEGSTQAHHAANSAGSGMYKRLVMPGHRDIMVSEYTVWQQSQVQHADLKAEYDKAGKLVLQHGWDLEQLHMRRNTKFLVDAGVPEGIAERYVTDIEDWWSQKQQGGNL